MSVLIEAVWVVLRFVTLDVVVVCSVLMVLVSEVTELDVVRLSTPTFVLRACTDAVTMLMFACRVASAAYQSISV